jgi:DNA-binding GntR family transcriptional regulator
MAGRRVEPGYLRIAGMLRADIAGGRFAAGAKLPSETQLMMRHAVSRSVAKWAIAVLKADGLVEGRQGSGVFVRQPQRVARHPHSFGPDWRPDLREVIKADRVIAARLALMPGDLVLYTRGRSLPVGGPIQITEAWKPVAAGGQQLAPDRCQDRLIVRPASPEELKALELPSRGSVIVITRDRLAGDVPTEAIDIVVASDSVELVYEFPEDLDGR